MTWEDMDLYWAWRGEGIKESGPPFEKIIHYAKIKFINGVEMRIAAAVEESGVIRAVNESEINWYILRGTKVEMPSCLKNA